VQNSHSRSIYKEANEFFADEFLLKKKWTQVEQKNFGFLDLKFDRNKKKQETDSSDENHFLPEYLVLSDYFKTSQIQYLVFFHPKKVSTHALRILIGWNLQPEISRDIQLSFYLCIQVSMNIWILMDKPSSFWLITFFDTF
jgi:hypothetical protein